MIGFWRTQAVDARDAGNDQHVAPLEQGMGGGVAHLVDFVVDRRVFFNECVGDGHVRFGLVVIVITHEVADRIVREKGFELVVQLRRQGLVVGQHQRRALELLHHIGHRIGLARAGYSQQGLVHPVGLLESPDQGFDRLRLVAGRFEIGYQFERLHCRVMILVNKNEVMLH